jgi:hypothetical protein
MTTLKKKKFFSIPAIFNQEAGSMISMPEVNA